MHIYIYHIQQRFIIILVFRTLGAYIYIYKCVCIGTHIAKIIPYKSVNALNLHCLFQHM